MPIESELDKSCGMSAKFEEEPERERGDTSSFFALVDFAREQTEGRSQREGHSSPGSSSDKESAPIPGSELQAPSTCEKTDQTADEPSRRGPLAPSFDTLVGEVSV